MSNSVHFKEVDAGFYLGFLEAPEGSPDSNFWDTYTPIPSQGSSCDELWCICDPHESFHTVESGLFDTYICLHKEPIKIKFLGSFKTLDLATKYLNQLFNKGVTFEKAPVVQSEYYDLDYSYKKQSIFI